MIGIIRRFDDLGRITIPKEYLEYLEISRSEYMDISITLKGEIVIRRVVKSEKIGCMRRFDELGRITIPMHIRRYLKYTTHAAVEIILNENEELIVTPARKRKRG